MQSTSNQSVNIQERDFLELLTTLPLQDQEKQAEHLEHMLTALRDANIEDEQRLKLMASVVGAADRFIATLRQHYIYETGALSEPQLAYVAQVKSLYYLMILVYDELTLRQSTTLKDLSKRRLGNKWHRYFNARKKTSNTLAIAIYQSLIRYQKLLYEEALCYQQSSGELWSHINHLYLLAYQQNMMDVDLSVETVTYHTNNIHQLYCQICLHSLLNIRAMRRPNILLVQRLLPVWSKHMVATIEPTTETRVFIDLHSDKPPRYLTANCEINPYEDHHCCLFLELTPMVKYFNSRKQTLIKDSSVEIGQGLLNAISMTVDYRYLQSKRLAYPTKYSAKQDALLFTGFSNIHHRIGDSDFTPSIALKVQPRKERPHYDMPDVEQNIESVLPVEVFDSLSIYRTLRLSQAVDDAKDESVSVEKVSTESVYDKGAVHGKGVMHSKETIDRDSSFSAPLPLQVMSLFLICSDHAAEQPHISMGVVRWLNLDTDTVEVEWQLLGQQAVACELRLEGREIHRHHFVPALLLGKDEQLQTASTLIVSSSYFQTNDRVMMSINNQQTHLRLGRQLLMTDEFSQYEIVQLGNQLLIDNELSHDEVAQLGNPLLVTGEFTPYDTVQL